MNEPHRPDPREVKDLRASLAAERERQRAAWNDLPSLREQVRRVVELSSVRRVAAAIGTSHEGLRRFLGGGKPYPVTLRKIVRWLESESADRPLTGREAFELVTRGLSPAGKARVREAMRRALLESGEPVPPWLAEDAGPDPLPD